MGKITKQELDSDFQIALEGALSTSVKNTDAKGIHTTVEFRRANTTLYASSVLSNPDVNGNYQTQTVSFYDLEGLNVISSKVITLTYGSTGLVVARTVS